MLPQRLVEAQIRSALDGCAGMRYHGRMLFAAYRFARSARPMALIRAASALSL
jgi:hypothetical protein